MAVKARLDGARGTAGMVLEPYDPMRLYARILLNYNGGVRDEDFARMDYRRFFGYVRELDLYLEEKAEAEKGSQGNTSGAAVVLNEFPQPEEYTGETVNLP